MTHSAPSGDTSRLAAFSPSRPILLLTDFPPDAAGGGAVIIRSLLTAEARECVVWTTLSPSGAVDGFRIRSLAAGGSRSLLSDSTWRVRRLRAAARSLVRECNAQAAWVVAHGAAVRIAPSLVDAGLPVHLTVHDDPAWGYALLTRRYLGLAPLFARDLRRSLRGARTVDVVSTGMASRYRRLSEVDPVVVHRGLPDPVAPSPPYDRQRGLSVAILGSTYGLREVGLLLRGLALASEQLNVPATLTLIGRFDETRVRALCPAGVRLELTGHLSEEEGVARLGHAFVLYMSYPFSPRGRVLRTTSFPTKLSTYAMAARPLLLHAPADASVAFLRGAGPYATVWSSRTPADGAKLLVALWRDERAVNTFHQPAEELRRRHFDLTDNRRVLFSSLNALVA
jgi:hypothetical protein